MSQIGNWKLEIGNSLRSRAGFTLLEIVIVIALIGVLGSVVISLVNPVFQFKKGRDVERKTSLRQIQVAFELYRADQGIYPAVLPNCGAALVVDPVTYLQKTPCDPKTTSPYNLERTDTTYSLIACLENVSDLQKDATNRLRPSGGTYCDGTDTWSYTLFNP